MKTSLADSPEKFQELHTKDHTAQKSRSGFLPIAIIVASWILLITGMTIVVVIASRHAPQSVPLDPQPAHAHER